ncbi:protein of unknown function [Hyphomicrobium sp. 1Nfss2.1]|uniref:hypothetical protein n=1 Tax=Hyphomicrobium sp. 1Nfss2.1 TaxID=3413936 RepID=UPI003C7E754E
MTKAERIRAIAKAYPELSTAEIGARVGCLAAYVRVTLRQRAPGKQSVHDARYYQKTYRARYRSDPEFRAKRKAHTKRWQQENREYYLSYMRSYRHRKVEASHA